MMIVFKTIFASVLVGLCVFGFIVGRVTMGEALVFGVVFLVWTAIEYRVD